jgi:hypothetical protein
MVLKTLKLSTTLILQSTYKSTRIKIIKRTMFTVRPVARAVNMELIRYQNQVGVSGNATQIAVIKSNPSALQERDMAYVRMVKYKKQAVTNWANDDTGFHSHALKESCATADCEKKQCPSLCTTFKEATPKGHTTHSPKIGSFCRAINDVDANGNSCTQYHVRQKEKKIMTDSQRNQHQTKKEIKTDNKQTNYVQSDKDVLEKLDTE